MKFLCVACDEPMKLEKTESPREGTISAMFECPECFTQVAMLTNPSETQMVQSLGVKIGPGGGEPSKCPFSGVLTEMGMPSQAPGSAKPPVGVQWTPEALARLENIPDFVRPMARQGIEHFAESQGFRVVDEAVLEQARGKFGM